MWSCPEHSQNEQQKLLKKRSQPKRPKVRTICAKAGMPGRRSRSRTKHGTKADPQSSSSNSGNNGAGGGSYQRAKGAPNFPPPPFPTPPPGTIYFGKYNNPDPAFDDLYEQLENHKRCILDVTRHITSEKKRTVWCLVVPGHVIQLQVALDEIRNIWTNGRSARGAHPDGDMHHLLWRCFHQYVMHKLEEVQKVHEAGNEHKITKMRAK